MSVFSKLRKVCFILSLVTMLVMLCIDILIKKEAVSSCFTVSKEYVHSIFSALITISTLSITVISIIISILDYEVYGLKLKEIVKLKNAPINYAIFIITNAIYVLTSIPALIYENYNYITIITIFSIIYTTYSSFILFHLLLKPNIVKKIIYSEIKSNNMLVSNFISKWLSEYKNAILDDNKKRIIEFSDLLRESVLIDKNNKNMININIIQTKLQEIFGCALEINSFEEAYKLVYGLNDKHYSYNFDRVAICCKYLSRIKYYAEEELDKFNFGRIINNIVNSSIIPSNDIIEISYKLFSYIIKNNRISEEYKIKLIDEGTIEICNLNDNVINGNAKSEILTRLINEIILESNLELSKQVYKNIFLKLYMSNLFNNNIYFVSVISKTIRTLFIYAVLDSRFINLAQKNHIKELCNLTFGNETIYSMSIRQLAFQIEEKILEFLIEDSLNFDTKIDEYNSLFRFNPSQLVYLQDLWSDENKIKFAVWFYLSDFGYCLNLESFMHIEESFYHYQHLSSVFYKAIIEEFDENKRLQKTAVQRVKSINSLFCKNNYYMGKENKEKALFEYINTLLREYNDRILDSMSSSNSELISIINSIPILIDKNSVDNCIELPEKVNASMSFISKDSDNSIIREFTDKYKSYISEKINDIVINTLPTATYYINEEGILSFINDLKDKEYISTSFDFRNIIFKSISKSISISESIINRLDAWNHKIKFHKCNESSLLKTELKYNIEIINVIKMELNNDQIKNYLEHKRISDNCFKIDDSVYDFEDAFNYIYKSRKKVIVELKFKCNITSDSGTIVKFTEKSN